MERKIGEIFKCNNEWYQCLEGNDCLGCVFLYDECNEIKSVRGKCTRSGREDRRSVIFKKLEKVGEPITVNGKKVQLLKTIIANCDNCAFYKDINCDFTCYPRKCYGGEKGTYVELKQNKEDMEEKKLNLKPFDIQKAREGKPVCTRDGRKVRIICFDRNDLYPIVALIECEDGKEMIGAYSKEGHTEIYEIKGTDLMMLPEKKEGWVNVYKSGECYDVGHFSFSKEDTEEHKNQSNYVATVKVSWEE